VTVHLWYSGKQRTFGGNVQFLPQRRRIPALGSPGAARLAQ
jgi:hypothetical protein